MASFLIHQANTNTSRINSVSTSLMVSSPRQTYTDLLLFTTKYVFINYFNIHNSFTGNSKAQRAEYSPETKQKDNSTFI